MKRINHERSKKKPKTAPRLRRFCCAICRKKGKERVESAPYYCPNCKHIKWNADCG